jgi:hypothetical protein
MGGVAGGTLARMETLTMRRKERPPVGVMASVKAGELNLLEAAEVSELGHRQTKRVWKRQDAAGLVHRLRGQPGRRPGAAAGGAEATRPRENNKQPRGHFQ